MSEPQSSGALAVEMAGLDVIPESERKGKPSDLLNCAPKLGRI